MRGKSLKRDTPDRPPITTLPTSRWFRCPETYDAALAPSDRAGPPIGQPASIAAPVASGWSVRRAGLAPTGKRSLATAHTRCGRFALPIEDLLMNGTQEWEGAVNQKQHKHLFAMCQCGKVKFEAVGPPILTGSCYCTSCQEAGRQFEQLASAPPVLDSDSGTGLILYRKDRVQCMMGQQYLEQHRLKPDSPTRRVIAKCCNSAMFLSFTKGHWLSMFRNRFPIGAPPLEMRAMTKERRGGGEPSDWLTYYNSRSLTLMILLISAWFVLGL